MLLFSVAIWFIINQLFLFINHIFFKFYLIRIVLIKRHINNTVLNKPLKRHINTVNPLKQMERL